MDFLTSNLETLREPQTQGGGLASVIWIIPHPKVFRLAVGVCHDDCLGNMGCPDRKVGGDSPGVLWSPVVPRNTAQGGRAQARREAMPRARVATVAPHTCLVTFLLFMNCFYPMT